MLLLVTPNQTYIKKLGYGSNFPHHSQLFSNFFGEIQIAQPKAEIKYFIDTKELICIVYM